LQLFRQTQNRYLQPYFDALRDGVKSAQVSRALDIEQRRVEEERRHNLAEEAIQRDEIRTRYCEIHANEADWRINQEIKDAFTACRAAHQDCDQLGWIMKIIAAVWRRTGGKSRWLSMSSASM
jgi:hypothetical protein